VKGWRRWFYKAIKVPPQVAYAIGLGPVVGRLVLLLTTTGRRSGLLRTTPLQYEKINGVFYVASAAGTKADWYRNLVTNPKVRVRVGRRDFTGIAESSTDPTRIADFLEYRLAKRPKMVGAILRRGGLPSKPSREQLEAYASDKALVAIHPVEEDALA